ncbi:FecR family protein [Novosphingobium terrae]|uniref:FecR family protein n=1 Tax=Novosphingobium terrae TaxID=2726189 RepID=UPI00197DDC29|nr:FecR domain-containing protein [Novosphingobium terrae]
MSPQLSRIGAIAETPLLTQAALWHERMQAPSPATQAAFAAWRDASPLHAQAYGQISAAHDQAALLAEENPLLALRQQTLARTMLARPSPVLPAARRRQAMIAAAALALVGTPLAAYSIHAWRASHAEAPTIESFHTDVGQQADVTLPDGSLVTLDTNSRLEVRFASGERSMRLEGQGWFRIRPSATPWRIDAGGQGFTASQGSFDLRSDPGQLRAYADNGRLTMSDDGAEVALAPGHLLTQRGSNRVIRDLPDPSGLTAWREGMLQFQNQTLGEAVSEFNRYRRQPIRLTDPRAGSLRISGAFRTADSTRFLDALSNGFPVRVRDDGHEGVTITAR